MRYISRDKFHTLFVRRNSVVTLKAPHDGNLSLNQDAFILSQASIGGDLLVRHGVHALVAADVGGSIMVEYGGVLWSVGQVQKDLIVHGAAEVFEGSVRGRITGSADAILCVVPPPDSIP